MTSYLVLKMLHILSAIVVMGTGAGIAFFMFMVSRTSNVAAIAVTARHVVLADWLFTTPAVALQFITGVLLMLKLGYSFTSMWFFTVIALFVFIGVCWLPVIAIQYRLRELAESSLAAGVLEPGFNKIMRLWTALGIPAFIAIMLILWLMIFKPFPVV